MIWSKINVYRRGQSIKIDGMETINENKFTFRGVIYVAEENWNDKSSGCDGCAFEYNTDCAWNAANGIPPCKSTYRKDGRSVIFIKA